MEHMQTIYVHVAKHKEVLEQRNSDTPWTEWGLNISFYTQLHHTVYCWSC